MSALPSTSQRSDVLYVEVTCPVCGVDESYEIEVHFDARPRSLE